MIFIVSDHFFLLNANLGQGLIHKLEVSVLKAGMGNDGLTISFRDLKTPSLNLLIFVSYTVITLVSIPHSSNAFDIEATMEKLCSACAIAALLILERSLKM
jgi:hypothetical protein